MLTTALRYEQVSDPLSQPGRRNWCFPPSLERGIRTPSQQLRQHGLRCRPGADGAAHGISTHSGFGTPVTWLFGVFTRAPCGKRLMDRSSSGNEGLAAGPGPAAVEDLPKDTSEPGRSLPAPTCLLPRRPSAASQATNLTIGHA